VSCYFKQAVLHLSTSQLHIHKTKQKPSSRRLVMIGRSLVAVHPHLQWR